MPEGVTFKPKDRRQQCKGCRVQELSRVAENGRGICIRSQSRVPQELSEGLAPSCFWACPSFTQLGVRKDLPFMGGKVFPLPALGEKNNGTSVPLPLVCSRSLVR